MITTINNNSIAVPEEILFQIFSNISDEDLALRVSLVCKGFLKIVNTESNWKERFIRLVNKVQKDKGNISKFLQTHHYHHWRLVYFCFKEFNKTENLMASLTAPIFGDPRKKGVLNEKGELNGKGIMIFPNGEIWKGEFKNDELNGRGIIHFPNRQVRMGKFQNDKLNGIGKIILEDGEIQKGNFKDNRLHGIGEQITALGESWRGKFKNGNFDKKIPRN